MYSVNIDNTAGSKILKHLLTVVLCSTIQYHIRCVVENMEYADQNILYPVYCVLHFLLIIKTIVYLHI